MVPMLSTMGGYKDAELVGTAPDASYYLLLPKTLVVKTGRRILMGGSSRRGRSS
jgi:hypothetical protein